MVVARDAAQRASQQRDGRKREEKDGCYHRDDPEQLDADVQKERSCEVAIIDLWNGDVAARWLLRSLEERDSATIDAAAMVASCSPARRRPVADAVECDRVRAHDRLRRQVNAEAASGDASEWVFPLGLQGRRRGGSEVDGKAALG